MNWSAKFTHSLHVSNSGERMSFALALMSPLLFTYAFGSGRSDADIAWFKINKKAIIPTYKLI